MITFERIEKLFAFDLEGKYCIEILFRLNRNEKYNHCCMGKLPSENTKKDVYWFGLTEDGNNSYDYETFEEMSSSTVFDGLSLREVWSEIIIEGIDGLDPEERIEIYIG